MRIRPLTETGEYGHIFSRLGMERKVVMGYWADADVQEKIGSLDENGGRRHRKQPYPCNADRR